MNILVTGGTGTVGSQVVRELLARGAQVQVLTRDPAKGAKLPAGVKAVTGDLSKVETVKRVFKGVDGVFLVNTVSPTEVYEGLLAACALREEKVKRVVYLSVHHADGAPWLPHFGGKLGVEQALLKSGVPSTILRPNNFYQNDYWFKDVLLQHGVYPQPIGDVGLHRVDVRDIAEAAAVALTTSGHEGQTYDLVGPEAHTGESTAQVWARALGRPIVVRRQRSRGVGEAVAAVHARLGGVRLQAHVCVLPGEGLQGVARGDRAPDAAPRPRAEVVRCLRQ